MTSIYFLLEGTAVSRLHRLKSTEVWYHHAGGVVRLVCFEPGGEVREIRLGCARDADVRPQVVIPAGGWFGAVLESVHDWALMGCAVAPGFEFQDFELARRSELLKQYPRHRTWIERLTLPDATNP
jgi:predicted cupin superfamily sugar epimerase